MNNLQKAKLALNPTKPWIVTITQTMEYTGSTKATSREQAEIDCLQQVKTGNWTPTTSKTKTIVTKSNPM